MYNRELVKRFENEVNSMNDSMAILAYLLEKSMDYTDSEGATVYLLEDDKLRFYLMENKKLKVHSGFSGEKVDLPPVELKITNACSYAALTKNVVNVENVYNDKSFIWTGPKEYDAQTGYKTKAVLVVPLADKDENVFGVLQLLNPKKKYKGKHIYTEEDEDIILDMGMLAAEAVLSLK